jgi:hypothetical protein
MILKLMKSLNRIGWATDKAICIRGFRSSLMQLSGYGTELKKRRVFFLQWTLINSAFPRYSIRQSAAQATHRQVPEQFCARHDKGVRRDMAWKPVGPT